MSVVNHGGDLYRAIRTECVCHPRCTWSSWRIIGVLHLVVGVGRVCRNYMQCHCSSNSGVVVVVVVVMTEQVPLLN